MCACVRVCVSTSPALTCSQQRPLCALPVELPVVRLENLVAAEFEPLW